MRHSPSARKSVFDLKFIFKKLFKKLFDKVPKIGYYKFTKIGREERWYIVKLIIFGAITIAMIVQDMYKYKVKNYLVLVGIISSLFFFIYSSGIFLIGNWFLSVTIPILLLYVLFIIHVIGAADIKMFAIIGGYFGTYFTMRCIGLAIILGAILSILKMIRMNNLLSRLFYFRDYISQSIYTKKVVPYYSVTTDGREAVIHFTLAIGLSALFILINDCYQFIKI